MKTNHESVGCVAYGVTKDPSGNDHLLVYQHYQHHVLNYKLIDKLHNTLNKLTNNNNLSVKTTELLNKSSETLKIIGNCTNCNYKEINTHDLDELHKLTNKIENCSANLEKEQQGKKKNDIIHKLNHELFEINIGLSKTILCKGSKEKEIRKLADKCGNEEIARLLYDCKSNSYDSYDHIQWISFDGFTNIEHLARGGFGEVHKAIWINGYYNTIEDKYYNKDVALKRIYNSSNKIVDILNEVRTNIYVNPSLFLNKISLEIISVTSFLPLIFLVKSKQQT